VIRVLIADDHALVREGVKRILEQEPGFAVVAEASTGEEAIEAARSSRPHIALLDVSMPGRGGIETAQEIKRRLPETGILMLTAHPEDRYAILCLKEGADGYITKDAAASQLVQAIRRIRAGGKYVTPTLADRLAASLATGLGRAPHELLSEREREVMLLISGGRTATVIAAELHLSVKTVSTYRSRILEKMGLRNNAELMRYAFESGLVR
jgi:DNA-binding NarL/FixJ family response regulator